MKAIVNAVYGSPDVLRLTEVEKPTPKENEVLIAVRAVSVNAADCHLMRGEPALMRLAFGLQKPKITILGADVAGRIEAVGSSVTGFQVGDEVFGDLSGCGFGGFAEYVSVPATAVIRKPASLTFETAAALPMASGTALQGLRDHGKVQAGQKVLIHGASGGVGTFAVQIAKVFGAEVTAVCSTRNVDMVRSLGADHVVDYTQQDFAQNGQRYDLIFAANGDRQIGDYMRALAPKGTYVPGGGSMRQVFQALLQGSWISMTGSKKVKSFVAQPNLNDLAYVSELIQAGKVKLVIDRCYPFSEGIDAVRYADAGHAKGKVIISFDA